MINTRTIYFLTVKILFFAFTNMVFFRFLILLVFFYKATLLCLLLLFCLSDLMLIFIYQSKSGCLSEDFYLVIKKGPPC